MRFLSYNPDQAYLLPPSVREVLGEDHLCFFVHRVVEELDLSIFEAGYAEEGRAGYAPALLLRVWLYVSFRWACIGGPFSGGGSVITSGFLPTSVGSVRACG